jgi:hypothetical protein
VGASSASSLFGKIGRSLRWIYVALLSIAVCVGCAQVKFAKFSQSDLYTTSPAQKREEKSEAPVRQEDPMELVYEEEIPVVISREDGNQETKIIKRPKYYRQFNKITEVDITVMQEMIYAYMTDPAISDYHIIGFFHYIPKYLLQYGSVQQGATVVLSREAFDYLSANINGAGLFPWHLIKDGQASLTLMNHKGFSARVSLVFDEK